jgi:hypothetical protein
LAGNTTCPHNAASQTLLRDRQTDCLMCGALLQAGGAGADGFTASYPGDERSEAAAATAATLNLPDLPF